MYLRWDYLFGAIAFFACFFFEPLLQAVGSQGTVIIICVGLVGIVIIKVVEYKTDDLRRDKDEDEED